MNKFYYLHTCSTCQRIIKELELPSDIKLQNIKVDKITPDQIDEMIELAGSAEKLFSRRAMKYKSMKLAERDLTEKDYRQFILDEYTFLKRPVLILNGQIFIGNQKKVIEAARQALTK